MKSNSIAHIKNKKILFTALNWGYGHVMRSVVILNQLADLGNEIWIVSTPEQQKLYESENVRANFIESPGYPFNFSINSSINIDLLFGLFRLLKHKKAENKKVHYWCKQHEIDLVIADQNVGFYHKILPSIIITHQLNLPLKWWQKPAQWIYNQWLNHYNEIWIPDFEKPNNLAGRLSETNRQNVRYIGWLSRFNKSCDCDKLYEKGALITGPEPYARQFYEQCKERFLATNEKCFIIYNNTEPHQYQNVEVLCHQSSESMRNYLCSTKLLITRCGYSTMMDLKTLGIENVELHATPGQAEQEYFLNRIKLNQSKS